MVQTTNYKRSIASSVSTGMKSVFGTSGRRFYELEHRTTSKLHQAGEVQKIIIDQIELGRDPKCEVRFDDVDCRTVSRHHAAIIRDGDSWKLKHLSSNSTYINGNKISEIGSEWYLQNGDEIQLSTNGPKLGFIVKEGSGSLVSSLRLSERLSLFGKQALRPYKRALIIFSIILVAALVGGIIGLNYLHREHIDLSVKVDEQSETIKSIADGLSSNYAESLKSIKITQKNISILSKRVDSILIQPHPRVPSSISKNVYYITAVSYDITLNDGTVQRFDVGDVFKFGDGEPIEVTSFHGTGFVLSDGRFVTAHHVAVPWDYDTSDPFMGLLNILSNNGYANISVNFVALSPAKEKLVLKSSQFEVGREDYQEGIIEGTESVIRIYGPRSDYAYAKTQTTGGLAFDAIKSDNLEQGTTLQVLGYPLDEGIDIKQGEISINPLFGNAIVSSKGLSNGLIVTNGTNYEHGNSGGPVFYADRENNWTVVGIVSYVKGRNLGGIVPISAIK